jgi:hypothetical protein
LEQRRRCGFLREAELGRERVVWARGPVSLTRCPVSTITPESLAYLEQFAAWRMEGSREMSALPARRADAFVILHEEKRKEDHDGGCH